MILLRARLAGTRLTGRSSRPMSPVGQYGRPASPDSLLTAARLPCPPLRLPHPASKVGLSWYRTRRDPKNRKTDQYFSLSSDGGATWSANKRITTARSDESGSSTDPNDYGDYEG